MKRMLAALFTFLALFCSDGIAKSVRVSILGLLKPTALHVTAMTNGILRIGSQDSPLNANDLLDVHLSEKSLAVLPQTVSAETVSLQCPSGCRFLLNIPRKLIREYRGNLFLYPVNNTIDIVLESDEDDFIASVTASEMSVFHEPEAWKAFAIVARSFLRAGSRHPELHADLCDTTHCQLYQGFQPEPALVEAVAQTRGLVLTYQQRPFRPFYSLSCGGTTASFEEIFNAAAPDYPFFPVKCSSCARAPSWTSEITEAQLVTETGVQPTLLKMAKNDIRAGDRSVSPESLRILIGRVFGWKLLPSNDFTFEKHGNSYTFTGRGSGHRIGLCQSGAAYLAHQGRTFREILSTYFPNTELRQD